MKETSNKFLIFPHYQIAQKNRLDFVKKVENGFYK